MNLHFISGLPRSGSTLLGALLNQNPTFRASISSPLSQVYADVHAALGVKNEGVDLINENQRHAILRSIFVNYYMQSCDKYPGKTELWKIDVCKCPYHDGILFDTSRAWSARHLELFTLFPDAKMICLVRPINEVLNSFEKLYRKNPLMSDRIWGSGTNSTARANKMLEPGGVVQFPYQNTKDAFFSGDKDKILFVRYSTLAANPEVVLQAIYQFIGVPFDWDAHPEGRQLRQIPDREKFDNRLGVPTLHRVDTVGVKRDEYEVLLPPELWQHHMQSAFWNEPTINRKGMIVL